STICISHAEKRKKKGKKKMYQASSCPF
ncbi:hypothetical protein EE612_031161, partial [Oryza sativa]